MPDDTTGGGVDPALTAIRDALRERTTAAEQPTQDSPVEGRLTPPPTFPPAGGVDPSLQPVLAASQQQGALNRPGVPNLVRLIGGLIKPSAAAGPLQRPPSRGDMTLDFVHNFLTSLASGLEASGHGPGANARGFGAAYLAPYRRGIEQFELQRQEREQESIEESRRAQAAFHTPSVQMLDPDGNPVMIPPSAVGSALAAQYRMAGQTRAAETRAQTARDIAAAKNPQIKITDDVASSLGLPASLVGQSLSAADIHRLVPTLKTVQTGAGVFLVNPANGKTVARLGEPVAVTTERMREANRITVEDMRQNNQHFVAAFNAASSDARAVFQTRMKGVEAWAKAQANMGYLSFGGIKDPNTQAKFKAEYDRRANEALQGLADAHNAQLPAAPASRLPKPTQGAGATQPSAAAPTNRGTVTLQSKDGRVRQFVQGSDLWRQALGQGWTPQKAQ